MNDGMNYPLSGIVLKGSEAGIAQAKAAAEAEGIDTIVDDEVTLSLALPVGGWRRLTPFLQRVQNGEFGQLKIGLVRSPRQRP